MELPEISIGWLLEKENLYVRYLALRFLKNLPDGNAELELARKEAYTKGAIGKILQL